MTSPVRVGVARVGDDSETSGVSTREAEVENLHAAARRQEDVLGFQCTTLREWAAASFSATARPISTAVRHGIVRVA
jgi:hypothetical protein